MAHFLLTSICVDSGTPPARLPLHAPVSYEGPPMNVLSPYDMLEILKSCFSVHTVSTKAGDLFAYLNHTLVYARYADSHTEVLSLGHKDREALRLHFGR